MPLCTFWNFRLFQISDFYDSWFTIGFNIATKNSAGFLCETHLTGTIAKSIFANIFGQIIVQSG